MDRNAESETIHAARISLRKTRFALWLFFAPGTRRLRKVLGRLNRHMSPVRDLDCLLMRLQTFAGSSKQESFFEHLRTLRHRHFQALRRALHAPQHGRALQQLLTLLERPEPSGSITDLQSLAGPILRRSQRRLKKVLKRLPPDPGPKDLHALRIACKHLRYACEFLEPVFSGKLTGLAHAWRRYQDRLGQLQDVSVAIRLMRSFLRETRHPEEQAWLRKSLQRLISQRERQHHLAVRSLQQMPAVRKRFKRVVKNLDSQSLSRHQ
jgi:CHAD domain-containing protein